MLLISNHKYRAAILTILLVWTTIFFWLLCPVFVVNIIMAILSLIVLFSIIFDKNYQLSTIFLSFQTSYVLYGYMLVNNLPSWLIMLGVLIISMYLFSYIEQKIEIAPEQKGILNIIFSLVVLETFLFLGYFLISPINRSLVIASVVYLIHGYCDIVLKNHENNFI